MSEKKTTPSELSFRYTFTHHCGQEHETIYRVLSGDFTVTQEWTPLVSPSQEQAPLWNYAISLPPPRTCTFSGTVQGIGINGIEMRDKKIACSKCGEDVLFPPKERDERLYFLGRRRQKEQRKSEWVREKRRDEHNEQRQREAYERKKCPCCHNIIRENVMSIVHEAWMYENGAFICQCPRPSLAEQTRIFLFQYRYGNCDPVTVPGVQFPNGRVTLSVKFPLMDEKDKEYTHTFDAMGKFKAMLNNHASIHDWSIEWVDAAQENQQP